VDGCILSLCGLSGGDTLLTLVGSRTVETLYSTPVPHPTRLSPEPPILRPLSSQLTIVKHLRQFLSRVDVLDALSATAPPNVPSSPTLVSAEFTKLHLRWEDDNSSEHGLRYDLQIGRRFVGGWQIFRDLSSNQFAITDLQQGSTFVVRL
jgi:hypothetical protein